MYREEAKREEEDEAEDPAQRAEPEHKAEATGPQDEDNDVTHGHLIEPGQRRRSISGYGVHKIQLLESAAACRCIAGIMFLFRLF